MSTTRTSLFTIARRPRRGRRPPRWRRLLLAVAVVASLGVKVEVKTAPITVGPVTVEVSLDLSVPVLGP